MVYLLTGYNSVDIRQQMELDNFKATILSLDRDDKGYMTFRNALVEKRISMIDCNELTKEITALERNATTGKIDHPVQTTSKVDGKITKSVGKDISDSLCGAIYNATISVDINELDRLEGAILTSGNSTLLTTYENPADKYFNFTQQLDQNEGIVGVTDEHKTEEDIMSQINKQIDREINQNQAIISKVRADNPYTKLTDQQIIDLYGSINNGGDFLIF